MKGWLDRPAQERMKNVYMFYLAIFGLLVAFIAAEILIEDYVLGKSLTFFEHMIPSGILYGAILLFVLLYAKKTGITNYEMGWHTSYVPKSLLIGLLATSGYLIAVVGFQIPLAFTSFFDIFIILGFTLLIGLTEEMAFRGYIQGSLMKDQSQMKAVLITGIFFAVLHLPSYIISGNYLNAIGLPSLILVGLILGYIRIHTGNIWGVIVAHATWDFYLFLFMPETGTGSELWEMITLLGASGAMWGSILLSMLLAKRWIDRPTQIPGEMALAYQLRIEKLTNHIWKFNDSITSARVRGYYQTHYISKYSEKLKMYELQLVIYKEYLPKLNEVNYKIIKDLVSCKLNLAKIESYLSRGGPPMKIGALEARRAALWREIQLLESQIGTPKYYIE